MTQKNMVLAHFNENGTITSMQAIREYGITRLSSIIFDLREEGYNIETEIIEVLNRFGKKCHVAQYRLVEE